MGRESRSQTCRQTALQAREQTCMTSSFVDSARAFPRRNCRFFLARFCRRQGLVLVGFLLLDRTGDVREHSVRLRAYQPDRTNDYYQDDGQHHCILGNVLALFVFPQFNHSSHKGSLPRPRNSILREYGKFVKQNAEFRLQNGGIAPANGSRVGFRITSASRRVPRRYGACNGPEWRAGNCPDSSCSRPEYWGSLRRLWAAAPPRFPARDRRVFSWPGNSA